MTALADPRAHVPDDITTPITTPRLRLRPAAPGDGEIVAEAVRDSLADFRPWFPWAAGEPDAAASEAHACGAWEAFCRRDAFDYLALDRTTGALVARCELRAVDWRVPSFEIGYWTRTGFTRRGYAIEVTRALLDLAFSRLAAERVEIRCDTRNLASRRVAESAGLALEGVLRNNCRAPDGRLRSTCVLAMLRAEHPVGRADAPGAAGR